MYTGDISRLEDRLFELEKKLEAKQQESQNLANIASVITSNLNIEAVLAAALEIGIRQVGGEVGAVVLVENGKPDVKISRGVESNLMRTLICDDSETMIDRSLRTGETLCGNHCRSRGKNGVTVQNAIVSPIIAKGRAIGAIIVGNSEGASEFSERDSDNLEMICKFTSVAIENANLFRETLEKQKMEQESDLVRQVQATFLPEDTRFDGVWVEARYIPARQVGGDYYDLISSNGKLYFLIGDVSNKGVLAALVMTSVYSIIRSTVTSDRQIEIAKLMTHLNDILCNEIIKSHGMFISLFMACLDIRSGILEYCNGGHPPPFYVPKAIGEALPLKDGGPLVGQFPGVVYRSQQIEVARGDRIFCYTDGVIESADRTGQQYGIRRLQDFAAAGYVMDTGEFSNAVKSEIDQFVQGADGESVDDYTTIVIDVIDSSPCLTRRKLQYPSCLEELERVYADLDRICAEYNVSDKTTNSVRVAVSEAMTNAVIHAHAGDVSKKIVITVEVYTDRLEISVADEGKGMTDPNRIEFDPIGNPDAEAGRGLGLIKHLMDEVRIDASPGRGTVVRMIKRLPKRRS